MVRHMFHYETQPLRQRYDDATVARLRLLPLYCLIIFAVTLPPMMFCRFERLRAPTLSATAYMLAS